MIACCQTRCVVGCGSGLEGVMKIPSDLFDIQTEIYSKHAQCSFVDCFCFVFFFATFPDRMVCMSRGASGAAGQ